MKTHGSLKYATATIKNGVSTIVLELAGTLEDFQELQNGELDVTLEYHSEYRTLRANRFYWTIVGKVAVARGMSTTEVHNLNLRDNGQPEGYDVWLRQDINWMKLEELHLKPTGETNGDYKRYLVIKPTHTYNTKEMARVIDGIIEMARDCGISTITSEEFNSMMANYDKAWKRKQVSQSKDGVQRDTV